jgi:RPA family protein
MAGSEVVNVYAGEYQPEAAGVLRSAEPPVYVAVVGKIHQYETDSGVMVSIQPEHISTVDSEIRDSWMAESINATQVRLGALESGESDATDAVQSVYNSGVEGIEEVVQAAAEELVPAGDDARSEPTPAQ